METPEKNEKVIAEALRMREEGKAERDIYAAFPEAEDELKAVFSTADFLNAQNKEIKPRRELLAAILEKTDVTNPAELGYRKHRGGSGRPSTSIDSRESVLTLMNIWKVIVPVGAALLLLVVFVSGDFGGGESLTLQQEADEVNGIESSLDGASDTECAVEEMRGEVAVKGAAFSQTDFAAFEKEMAAESKSVELGNNFDAFFAEEAALNGEL